MICRPIVLFLVSCHASKPCRNWLEIKKNQVLRAHHFSEGLAGSDRAILSTNVYFEWNLPVSLKNDARAIFTRLFPFQMQN